MNIIELLGIPLKVIIIVFGMKGVVDTIIWLRRNKGYSYAWIKKASAFILGITALVYIYLLVRTFIPMTPEENYWFGAVIIRILVTLYTVILATGANIRNMQHRR